MSAQLFAQILLGIILIGTCLALFGVWFPEFFNREVAGKLIWTFVVLALATAISGGLLTYLPGLKPEAKIAGYDTSDIQPGD